ncbi:MAG TPA: hypothetical protein VFJ20_11205 [Gemmatimonadaceae bacterium]|nr:hypothetical protein [Gemmatimonadaceae bacterium]
MAISADALAGFGFAPPPLVVPVFAVEVFGCGEVGSGLLAVAVVFGAAPLAGAFPVNCGAAGVILGGGGDAAAAGG